MPMGGISGAGGPPGMPVGALQGGPPGAQGGPPNLMQSIQGKQESQFTPENGQFGTRMPPPGQPPQPGQHPQGPMGPPGQPPQGPMSQPQGQPPPGMAFAAGGYADGGVPGQNPFTQALQQAQAQASLPMMQGQAPEAGMDQGQFQSLLSGAQANGMSDDQRANLLNAIVQRRGQPSSAPMGAPAASPQAGLPSLFQGAVK